MSDDTLLEIEVVYALPDRQTLLSLRAHPPLTAEQAVQRSGILRQHPELIGRELMLGIFGERVTLQQLLQTGDRVEIYRPLLMDPREARRRRAAKGLTMSDGDPEV